MPSNNAKPLSLNPFYGFPTWLIAQWCCVTKRTAKRWKAGTLRPSPGHLRLFRLHADRRILGDAWEGWAVDNDVLVDPVNQRTTQPQLRAYAHVYALAFELARKDPAAKTLLDAYVRSA
jgi:hypothetical protein